MVREAKLMSINKVQCYKHFKVHSKSDSGEVIYEPCEANDHDAIEMAFESVPPGCLVFKCTTDIVSSNKIQIIRNSLIMFLKNTYRKTFVKVFVKPDHQRVRNILEN